MITDEGFLKSRRIGANRLADGSWEFLLWAPHSQSVGLHFCGNDEVVPMHPVARGYHHVAVSNLDPHAQYLYRLDAGRELPDPASRYQPQGVHGPSQIVNTAAFSWTDADFQGRDLADSIFYEIHVGTYTSTGTFDAVIDQLPMLSELGITTIEIMPVAQFPGARNWGYDGTYLFAPQNSYGGPASLQRLVNAAHLRGLSVALDVVYNHLGPEGNYLSAFGPYFTDRYRTPWGQAINFDGPDSDEVRRFFIENALYWLEQYHFDALRLDAVHGIFDFGARHFLAELRSAVAELSMRLGRKLHVIAESDLNDSRMLRNAECGFNLDAQWSDDFHHSVHALLTQERQGYYSDFGGITPLVETLKNGWFYSGQYSEYRKRHHGDSPAGLSPTKFVICNQNHDQVGNRALGERLSGLVGFEALKLAAGVTLLSPFVPLLFMGEEYGETAPFQYFTSHGDPDLVEAVRRGRREEFAAFGWQNAVPDPQDEETFQRSHLRHSLREKDSHRTLLDFYREVIRIRRERGIGSSCLREVQDLTSCSFLLAYEDLSPPMAILFNFGEEPLSLEVPRRFQDWELLLNSASTRWNGPVHEGLTSAEHSPAVKNPDASQAHPVQLEMSAYSFVILAERRSSRGAK